MKLESNGKGIKKGRPSKMVKVLLQLKKLGISFDMPNWHFKRAEEVGECYPTFLQKME